MKYIITQFVVRSVKGTFPEIFKNSPYICRREQKYDTIMLIAYIPVKDD